VRTQCSDVMTYCYDGIYLALYILASVSLSAELAIFHGTAVHMEVGQADGSTFNVPGRM